MLVVVHIVRGTVNSDVNRMFHSPTALRLVVCPVAEEARKKTTTRELNAERIVFAGLPQRRSGGK